MKKSILSAVIFMTGVAMNDAKACTVMPVDSVIQGAELVAKTREDLKIDVTSVTGFSVAGLHADYIWTPMCPEGLSASATVTIQYQKYAGAAVLNCSAVAEVKKTLMYGSEPRYEVVTIQPASCLQ